jgi:hypothetical protein
MAEAAVGYSYRRPVASSSDSQRSWLAGEDIVLSYSADGEGKAVLQDTGMLVGA